MACLLFPGRHHLLTNFQLEYLTYITEGARDALRDVHGEPLSVGERIDTLIWAVTSANHSNTRRNPLPAHRREVAIEAFAAQLAADSFVYLIDDVGTTPRFADYVLKKIEVESQGRFRLTPENTVVGCSTPEVIALYEALGFQILPVELSDLSQRTYHAKPPWEVLDELVQFGLEGQSWWTAPVFLTETARATRQLYRKYDFDTAILDLHRSPLLTDDGDLTATRDYNTYVRAFDEGAERKYELIRDLVRPGRIVDIGCCTGAVLKQMSHDDRLREADLYGIEVARQLYTECLHRKQRGDFGNEHVFFYHTDFASKQLFPEHAIDTFTTFSLTHEIESYAGRAALLHFIDLLRRQLNLAGRWLNVDVVGPENPEQEILLELDPEDGRSDDYAREFDGDDREAFRAYLQGMSTYARFLRFARDFRREEGYRVPYEVEHSTGRPRVRLKLGDAGEFLSKKDYVDNWASEMHETFCFWSFTDWRDAVEQAGFEVLPESKPFTNPWIVEHRYRGKVRLLERRAGDWREGDFPVTNILLACRVPG